MANHWNGQINSKYNDGLKRVLRQLRQNGRPVFTIIYGLIPFSQSGGGGGGMCYTHTKPIQAEITDVVASDSVQNMLTLSWYFSHILYLKSLTYVPTFFVVLQGGIFTVT